jgi:hypothetical protein
MSIHVFGGTALIIMLRPSGLNKKDSKFQSVDLADYVLRLQRIGIFCMTHRIFAGMTVRYHCNRST